MNSTTIVGYAFDASMHCVGCTRLIADIGLGLKRQPPLELGTDEHGIALDLVDGEGNPVTPIFCGEDSYGQTCDDCNEPLDGSTPEAPELFWFGTSSGRIELQLTMEQANSGSHQGQCDADVLELSKMPDVACQLERIEPALLAAELEEYGAWDAEQLADHEENIQRILWLACCDITEESRNRV